MYHHFPIGMIFFGAIYLGVVAGFMYILFSMSTSLKRMADRMDWIGEKVGKMQSCITESNKSEVLEEVK
ncbi:MAG: hypothetical protein LLG02_03125 [Pelosinus sp.]|nr:hypothetical protein [Pelosinus sp.]